jgi:HAMP domain-containing protein
LAAFDLFVALVFVFVWRLSQRAARKLERRIDELNALEGQR